MIMKAKDFWWRHIPVSVNNSYGDPFSKLQMEDTLTKIMRLRALDMKFSVCTKAVLSNSDLEILHSIGTVSRHNMFLQYSLTGLDEGGYSFDERVRTIYKLFDEYGQISIMFRPFIAGRNDSEENIDRIVKVASETGKVLILGGLHDQNKRKIMDKRKKDQIIEKCILHNVTYHNKTSCAAATQFKIPCWVHDLKQPKNVDVLNKLGYRVQCDGSMVTLHEATLGDLNFVRLITGTRVGTYKLSSNYNILSCSSPKRYFECSSSWFSWSRNVACEIACDYCIINEIEYLSGSNRLIGCFPADIIEVHGK